MQDNLRNNWARLGQVTLPKIKNLKRIKKLKLKKKLKITRLLFLKPGTQPFDYNYNSKIVKAELTKLTFSANLIAYILFPARFNCGWQRAVQKQACRHLVVKRDLLRITDPARFLGQELGKTWASNLAQGSRYPKACCPRLIQIWCKISCASWRIGQDLGM